MTNSRTVDPSDFPIKDFSDLNQLFEVIGREAVAKEQMNQILAKWEGAQREVLVSLRSMERCMERVLVTMEVSNAYMAALLAKTPRERQALIETAERKLADLNIHIENQAGTNVKAGRDAGTGDIHGH